MICWKASLNKYRIDSIHNKFSDYDVEVNNIVRKFLHVWNGIETFKYPIDTNYLTWMLMEILQVKTDIVKASLGNKIH